ncbi:hypothetical protein JCM8547_001360 [Rhodosporidiobolus lusitaniae]
MFTVERVMSALNLTFKEIQAGTACFHALNTKNEQGARAYTATVPDPATTFILGASFPAEILTHARGYVSYSFDSTLTTDISAELGQAARVTALIESISRDAEESTQINWPAALLAVRLAFPYLRIRQQVQTFFQHHSITILSTLLLNGVNINSLRNKAQLTALGLSRQAGSTGWKHKYAVGTVASMIGPARVVADDETYDNDDEQEEGDVDIWEVGVEGEAGTSQAGDKVKGKGKKAPKKNVPHQVWNSGAFVKLAADFLTPLEVEVVEALEDGRSAYFRSNGRPRTDLANPADDEGGLSRARDRAWSAMAVFGGSPLAQME